MSGQLEESFSYIEIGRLANINYATGTCDLETHDVTSSGRKSMPYPLPYAGNGWGILVGPEEGSLVTIGYDKTNRPWILSYRANTFYYNDNITGSPQASIDDFPYRKPSVGEIILQSKVNSAVILDSRGSIRLETINDTYIELNNDLETIVQQSVNVSTTNEAGTFGAGLVRRDVREEADKELDALFGNTFGVNTSEMLFSDVIGQNPEYKRGDFLKGLYDPEFLSSGVSASKNPALTEIHYAITEYADSNVGLDEIRLIDAQRAVGKVEVNRLFDIQFGTVVNDLGKIVRFDYGFGKGTQGHGKIFKASKDFFFDKTNTLKSPKESANFEKVITKLAKINAAMMMKLLLHTKGADNKGNLEADDFRGALWSLLVDKEGFTKLEIPAATDLGDAKGEPGRAGKSLLADLNGSLTLALGKESSDDTTINNVLSSDVSHSTKGRKDRSLTMDAEGNIELVVGADTEKKQSLMLAADGSIEAKVGKDTDNEQSIKITTDGGIFVTINGPDKNKDAINLNITGNVTEKIDGNVSSNITGTIDITTNDKVTLDIKADAEIKTSGACKITSTGSTDIKATGNCNVDGALVNLGKNAAAQLVNNLPVCLVTGAPHAIGNINVKV